MPECDGTYSESSVRLYRGSPGRGGGGGGGGGGEGCPCPTPSPGLRYLHTYTPYLGWVVPECDGTCSESSVRLS